MVFLCRCPHNDQTVGPNPFSLILIFTTSPPKATRNSRLLSVAGVLCVVCVTSVRHCKQFTMAFFTSLLLSIFPASSPPEISYSLGHPHNIPASTILLAHYLSLPISSLSKPGPLVVLIISNSKYSPIHFEE